MKGESTSGPPCLRAASGLGASSEANAAPADDSPVVVVQSAEVEDTESGRVVAPPIRGLHSSASQLILSRSCH